MKKYRFAVVFVLFFCSLPACAEQATVSADFAKKMVDWNRTGGAQAEQSMTDAMDALNRKELRALHRLIQDDISRQTGSIVSPPLPVEYRTAGRLINLIADRLGILGYNVVAEGRIIGRSGLPSTVSYYIFKPHHGPEFEVYIGASTIMPPGSDEESIGSAMRIFVRAVRSQEKESTLFRQVLKIELLKDDPDAESGSFGVSGTQAFAAQHAASAEHAAAPVTDAYARMIVKRAAEYTPEGRRFVADALHALSESELRALRTIIAEDLERAYNSEPAPASAAPEAVVPRYAFAERLALWVIRMIDDRLGSLECELEVQGTFLRITNGGTTPVVFYDFKADSGKTYSVAVDDSTLWLYRAADGTLDVGSGPGEHSGRFRLFLHSVKADKPTWYSACKVEPL